MHRAIADDLTDEQLVRARDRVAGWLRDGSVHPRWAAAWEAVLDQPTAAVAKRISLDDAEMTQLRQSTPFAGMLPNRQRWQILRDVH